MLCRYENIQKQQAAKLRQSHERSMQLLKSQERPFSFYGKALAKEEAAKHYKPPTAKDFQKPFKANPIPQSSLEVRRCQDLCTASHHTSCVGVCTGQYVELGRMFLGCVDAVSYVFCRHGFISLV